MSKRDWHIFRADHNITVKGGGSIPNPIRNWQESGLPEELLVAIKATNYKNPTPIQMQAIPISLQGRDSMCVDSAGSGKSAAFILPMLARISKLPKITPDNAKDGPYALVMVPLREIAQQLEEYTTRFASLLGLRCVSLFGGLPIDEQGHLLRQGCEIVIATPGRLIDCLEGKLIVFNQCHFVVLDEADRMIDALFEPQVYAILDAMPAAFVKSENEEEAERQERESTTAEKNYRVTSIYTSTIPPALEHLARKYLRRPATIAIGPPTGRTSASATIVVEFLDETSEKTKKLESVIANGPKLPIIVIANTMASCKFVLSHLETLGYRCEAIHSDRTKEQREFALEGFRAGRFDVIVSTDVAFRGTDTTGVTHVINYDMPRSIEDYLHRMGRTRALITLLMSSKDTEIMYDLKNLLLSTGNEVPKELADHPAASKP